jgi:hypothetical protein
VMSVRFMVRSSCVQTALVNWRVKNFEPEARAAFAFLTEQGFTVDTEPPAEDLRRPAGLMVRFRAPEATVETSLALGSAGEDSIHTTRLTVTGSTEFGPTVAHKGHEMLSAMTDDGSSTAGVSPWMGTGPSARPPAAPASSGHRSGSSR